MCGPRAHAAPDPSLAHHGRAPHAFQAGDLPSLEAAWPAIYEELFRIRNVLERHYRDMLDIEFTVQVRRNATFAEDTQAAQSLARS